MCFFLQSILVNLVFTEITVHRMKRVLSCLLLLVLILLGCNSGLGTLKTTNKSSALNDFGKSQDAPSHSINWTDCYNKMDEMVPVMLSDEEKMEEGEKLYNRKCKRCHGKNLEGGKGPNLTDPYWIYGGGLKDMAKIVVEGTSNGMNSFAYRLSCQDVGLLLAYIRSKEGTDPKDAKGPEGEKE